MIIAAAMLLGAAFTANAQVTIGSDELPHATLDVVGDADSAATAEGIIAPRLTGNELKAKDGAYGADQTGAVVYVTAPVTSASAKTANVTAAGYYYFDGTLWHSVSGVDNNTLYEISYESSTSLLTLTPTTGDGSSVAIPLPKYAGSTSVTLESGNSFQRAALTGDATAAANSNTTTVERIQGIPVSTTEPVNNQILQYNGTNWTPATLALPMVLGNLTGNNQVINMADYTRQYLTDLVEVPIVSYTLPPGRWMIFYYVPFMFNFTDASIAQLQFFMGFASEDNSDAGNYNLSKIVNGAVVNNISHRDLVMGIIDNTTGGDVKYTLRVGDFWVLRKNISWWTLAAPGSNITIMPSHMGAYLYAIGVK